jgi:hypothetical protein
MKAKKNGVLTRKRFALRPRSKFAIAEKEIYYWPKED